YRRQWRKLSATVKGRRRKRSPSTAWEARRTLPRHSLPALGPSLTCPIRTVAAGALWAAAARYRPGRGRHSPPPERTPYEEEQQAGEARNFLDALVKSRENGPRSGIGSRREAAQDFLPGEYSYVGSGAACHPDGCRESGGAGPVARSSLIPVGRNPVV